ncbi:MAG: D-alanine--D-alanine ligase, partial [Lentisphaeria bacterium]|nr:D-alanine--D-alanine ligase [Lentisphaeria bacterium]
MKLKVAVLFGGASVEHEVAVISGIQAIMNLDKEKYDVIPVYLTKDSEMYIGSGIGTIENYRDIPALLESSQRVILARDEGEVYLVPFPKQKKKGLFGKLSGSGALKGSGERIRVDLAFPIVHGKMVEDGTIAGYLRVLGVPFVGPDVGASAFSMDKYVSKVILQEAGVPVLPGVCFNTGDYRDIDRIVEVIEDKIGYPVIIKPVDLGSSVGISVAKDRAALIDSVDDAFTYAHIIMAEHAITQLREINCAVLGNDSEAIASECEEPHHTDEILSYRDKYQRGGSKGGGSKGMAGVARKIPADLSPEERERVRSLAVRSFQALRCSGVARIDFMNDETSGELYFNEINPIPGSL